MGTCNYFPYGVVANSEKLKKNVKNWNDKDIAAPGL